MYTTVEDRLNSATATGLREMVWVIVAAALLPLSTYNIKMQAVHCRGEGYNTVR